MTTKLNPSMLSPENAVGGQTLVYSSTSGWTPGSGRIVLARLNSTLTINGTATVVCSGIIPANSIREGTYFYATWKGIITLTSISPTTPYCMSLVMGPNYPGDCAIACVDSVNFDATITDAVDGALLTGVALGSGKQTPIWGSIDDHVAMIFWGIHNFATGQGVRSSLVDTTIDNYISLIIRGSTVNTIKPQVAVIELAQ